MAPFMCEEDIPSEKSGNTTNNKTDRDIAIVGYSYRFPAEAVNDEQFWKLLVEKRCAMTEWPADRMNVSGWYHPDKYRRGQVTSRGACFLEEDVSLFDAAFFSLSGDEAAALDPQQRHMLEVTYMALENAGIPMDKMAGSQTSVHVGCFGSDYRLMRLKEIENTTDYDVLGISMCMTANRVSWFFDWRGASVNIDTACSSSLVALDMACQGLVNGEADMGIAAGTNLLLSPDMVQVESNVNMLSPDSISYSFDHRANGFSRGEGTGVVVLKRLQDALRDGDTVRAVIRATGSNQDGLTASGIMQPNGASQTELIRRTYEKAGLSLEPCRFFEAHGTGTPVGDPIECDAIGEAFRGVRSPTDPLIVGSVKSNIGHLEGASGIAALIKTIMVLEKGIIPPNTNFEKPNPRIDLQLHNLCLPLEAMAWPTPGLRRASVNSFGVGGSNAHAILDDAYNYLCERGLKGNHLTVESKSMQPKQYSVSLSKQSRILSIPKLLTISATTKAGFKDMVRAYKAYFDSLSFPEDNFQQFINDLAHTLNTRRTVMSYKSFWLASSPEDLYNMDQKISTASNNQQSPVLGFVFTGQGAQWAEMGRELLRYPGYRASIGRCQQALESFGCQWSLVTELLQPQNESRINEPEIAQPANTALQIALVDLLDELNVHPAAVIGHSSGEIAAAYTVKAISLSDSMRIAYFRGLCARELAKASSQPGAMLAVGLSDAQAQVYVDRVIKTETSQILGIACVNSPKSVTISGYANQVDRLQALFDADKVFSRKLRVPVGYHSAQMNQISEVYRRHLKGLDGELVSKPFSDITMVSSVTGKTVEAAELAKPDYWVANLVSPVQFTKAIFGVCTDPGSKIRKKLDCSHRGRPGVNILVEIGPHSAMQGPVRDTLELLTWGKDINYFPIIRRQEHAIYTFLSAIGNLYSLGVSVALGILNQICDSEKKEHHLLVDLPPYQFNHSTSYWREGRLSKRIRLGGGRLDLLGKPVADWNHLEARWTNHIRLTDMPWVKDHVVKGVLLYPAAGMVVMAIEAAHQMADPARCVSGFELEDLTFHRALTIPRDADGIETSFLLRTRTENGIPEPWMEFRLFSYENENWNENCYGRIKLNYTGPADAILDDWLETHNDIASGCTSELASDSLYSTLHRHGYEFGPNFQTILDPKCNLRQAISSVQVFQWPASQYPQPHVIHPTTLDGIFQLSSAALIGSSGSNASTALPTGVGRLWIAKEGLSGPSATQVQASASVITMHSRGNDFDISATDEQRNRILVQVQRLQTTTVADGKNSNQKETNELPIYQIEYLPDVESMNPAQLALYCAPARPQEAEPIQYFRDVNFIQYKFLDDSLASLSANPMGPRSTIPHIQRYIEWAQLQQRKFQSGELPNARPEWKDLLHDTAYFEAACNRISAANDLGAMYVHTGHNLLSILRGEKDPLEFIFTGDRMSKTYTELNNRPGCFGPWGRYLQALARKSPTMRILEVGAGTGGTTIQMLRAMSTDIGLREKDALYASYHYTDISAAFFEKAEERFHQFPRMEFQILDITQDPANQGFELESYDLIIAANALHATPSMNQTMTNVRSLLKPQGKLMLFEVTRPEIIRPGFIAGLMQGWWNGVDEGRLWSPALTLPEWNTVLQQTGFRGVEIIFPEYQNSECQESCIIVGTAGNPAPPVPSFCFIVDPTSAAQEHLLAQTTKALHFRYPESRISTRLLEDSRSIANIAGETLVFLGETENPILSSMSRGTFGHIQHLLSECKSILWVTAGGGKASVTPEYGLVDGLARSLRSEKTSRRICTLALDMDDGFQARHEQHIVSIIDRFLLDLSRPVYEPEFVEIQGQLHVPRLQLAPEVTEELYSASQPYQLADQPLQGLCRVQLTVGSLGLLSSLHWTDSADDSSSPLLANEVYVDNKAAGTSISDVSIALDRAPNTALGLESAGIIVQAGESSGFSVGDRVLAFGSGKLQTKIRVKSETLCRLPNELSFTDAAVIPVAFGTMWHALVEVGRLQRGQSVLIHAGAGASGQAAIQLAKYFGAKVYTTVSTAEKKRLLIERYGIPADRIFGSRDTYFARGVRKATQGRGVDLVVNFIDGDVQRLSCDCISRYGQLIHLSSAPSSAPILLSQSARQVSFTCLDIVSWMNERPDMVQHAIQNILSLVKAGYLSPGKLSQVQDAAAIEKTFQAIQDGTTTGRLVIDLAANAVVPTVLAVRTSFTLRSDATYVLAGGLGGLGRVTAQWMADHGARNLVLLGRSGPKTQKALDLIQELQKKGVKVHAPPCDLMDAASVRQAMTEVSGNMPPVRGCVQGSMVLRNGLFGDMSHDDWRPAVECKGLGSKHLTRNLPSDLDFFILLSSLSGIFGNQGQSNYSAGCSYLDSFARHKVAQGKKVISMDLGIMVDDGILVETDGYLDQVMKKSSFAPVSRSHYLALLSLYCNPDRAISTPTCAQILLGLPVTSPSSGSDIGDLLEKPISSRLKLERISLEHVSQSTGEVSVRSLFSKTTSLQEGRETVSQALIDKMIHSYRLIPEDTTVDEDATLSTYRVDSLLAVELCNWISKEFMADVAVLEIMGGATFATVNMLVASRSQLPHPQWS